MMIQFMYGIKEETFKAVRRCESNAFLNTLFEKKHVDIAAARNQKAAFQLILYSEEEFLLSITDTTSFDKRGLMGNIRLKFKMDDGCLLKGNMNIIGFVEDDDRLLKADILLDNESIHVDKKDIQPVWVEIDIPEAAAPGLYNGVVEIYSHFGFENEEKIGEVSFCIDVKNVTLPDPKDYKFYLDLWQHNSNIARKHEVELWSDKHFIIMENYIKSLAALGQKAVTVIASEIPWSGQRGFRYRNNLSDLYEYSMIKVIKHKDGSFDYDYTIMQRYIDMCFQSGIKDEIEVFGLFNIWISEDDGYAHVVEDYPDDIRVRYLDESDMCYKYIRTGKELEHYLQALERYFIGQGLIQKVRIAADEPADIGLFKKRLNNMKKVAPAFKYKAALKHTGFIEEFQNDIQDFVPKITYACEAWDSLLRIKEIKGNRLLWYVSCIPPQPNHFIGSPLLESRLTGLLTTFMGFEGFLRWNYTAWPDHPREKIYYRFPEWKAGDTCFVYPGCSNSPLLSLRYKALKRGIEDFELVRMIQEIHAAPEIIVDRIRNKILKTKDIRNFHYSLGKKAEELYSLDYDDYREVRNLLLNELDSNL